MVTTQLDFVHLRTTAGLAAQVRRVTGRMKRKNFEKHIDEAEHKLKQAIERGEIEGVQKNFEKLLGMLENKEHYLYIIAKDELTLLNEEEKVARHEMELDNQLKPFLQQLNDPKLQDEFTRKIDQPLADVCANIHKRTDQIRRTLAYLEDDNVSGVSRRDFINSISSERGIERVMRREARYEKRYVKREQSGIHKLYVLFDEISADIKQGKKELAERKLREFFKSDRKVFLAMKAEADYIYDVVTKDTFLYVKLMEFVKGETVNELKLLSAEKYPQTDLDRLTKQADVFFEQLWDHVKSIYSLARYENIHAG
ncbi:MAG TPA: hypothetical protein VJ461_02850 [Candidatus Nanoarchaeia archaeon]|nr:hypothetical protein [Candidatus Nanoarchaeia archaeon]